MAHRPKLHSFVVVKRLPWAMCSNCGLLTFRNEFTAWCIRNGCNHAEHPRYKTAMKTLSGSGNESGQSKES